MLKELRALWEKCKDARDNLDKDALEHGTFHGDVCCCVDCEACRDYLHDLPSWKIMLANFMWGEP